MEFYEKLSSARKAKGFSQEDLAARLDVSRQAVSKWENGTAQPEMNNIIKLCSVLNITPNELFGYDSAEKEPGTKDGKHTHPGIFLKAFAMLLIAVLAAFAIKSVTDTPQTEPEKEYILTEFTASAFTCEALSNNGASSVQVKVSYSPSVSGSDCAFSTTIMYNGSSFSVPTEYKNGICTASFAVPYYTNVTVYAFMEKGEYSFTYPLAVICDANASGYTYYPVD